MTPRQFTIKIADDVLADLRARLNRVRWPDEPPDAGWRYGTSLAYMKELVEYWRTRYDWRVHEARLNRLRHFTVDLDGIDLHFIHEPGVGPAPMPLLLSHGWPGSIVEFEQILFGIENHHRAAEQIVAADAGEVGANTAANRIEIKLDEDRFIDHHRPKLEAGDFAER